MNDKELRPIKGFEGLYSISSSGEIFSWITNSFRIPNVNRDGYLRLTLHKDKKKHCIEVHRAVANAWLEKPEGEGWTIDHKNGNKLDNRVENLEWVSKAENIKRSWEMGLRHKPHRYIYCVYKDNELVGIFRTIDEMRELIGLSKSRISYNARTQTMTSTGYLIGRLRLR